MLSTTVRTTKKFTSDFELVAAYYKCDDSEIVNMKLAARADMKNAEVSFALLADEIRTNSPKLNRGKL